MSDYNYESLQIIHVGIILFTACQVAKLTNKFRGRVDYMVALCYPWLRDVLMFEMFVVKLVIAIPCVGAGNALKFWNVLTK